MYVRTAGMVTFVLRVVSGFLPARFFNSLYLLITILVLHNSRLTSDLLHSLFQLNGVKIRSRKELRNEVNTVEVKRANQKKRDKLIKPGH